MNEDAQGALLKTLEEPPAGVTIILCADDEDRLLPTIRSRCARLRLGRVGARDVEAILADHGLTDTPLAGRLARLSGGRPGVAMAYARSPGRRPAARRTRPPAARPVRARSSSARLAAIRSAGPTALDLVDALDAAAAMSVEPVASPRPAVGRAAARRRRQGRPRPPPPIRRPDDADDAGRRRARPGRSRPPGADAPPRPSSRSGWTSRATSRSSAADGTASVRDPDLLEESRAAAAALDPGGPARFLATLERGARARRRQRVARARPRLARARLAGAPRRLMDEALEAVVRGRVQGVGFRYFAHREAMALGLAGWVANESDGSVRCLAVGDRASARCLRRAAPGRARRRPSSTASTWPGDRPPPARVTRAFSIRSGGHRGD